VTVSTEAGRQEDRRRIAWVEDARALGNGARFFRCALQVNPYAYLADYRGASAFASEDEYNAAIVEACQREGVEVIGVTDHYRISESVGLIQATQRAGIVVFPGFEAKTKEGVHFLCLFEPGTPADAIERKIGACGVYHDDHQSPTGKHDSHELLEECDDWGAACIAAHVASAGGLLRVLQGQPRIAAWRSPHLLAAVIPGPISDAPEGIRQILENKDAAHEREHPVAILNAKDVCDPSDFADRSHSTLVKMSEPTLAGLRQAFLDPESRVRLLSDPPAPDRTEIVALRWTGGFLDDVTIHLSGDLNVVIGGRGTGKSTVVESIRYVLDLEPLGEEATATYRGITRNVLRSGTRISVLVSSHTPARKEYVVERTVPDPPLVRDAASGDVLDLLPRDLGIGAEVYGQHEISELARDAEKRTRLLDRFVEVEPSFARRKQVTAAELELSRTDLVGAERERARIDERLAALPGLEETLERFREAGVEQRLKEKSLLVTEERVIATAVERLASFDPIFTDLRDGLPIDQAFVSSAALRDLPGAELLAPIRDLLDGASRDLSAVADQLEQSLADARKQIDTVRGRWEERRAEVDREYERTLRELQRSDVDGDEFIRLRRDVEELRPLRDRGKELREAASNLRDRRRNLLADWEELKAEKHRSLERAAKKVTRQLRGRVRVTVTAAAEREPLMALLREQVGGRLSEACEALRRRPDLSLRELAEAARSGRQELISTFGLPEGQAQKITEASEEAFMRIEELELPSISQIELNVAGHQQPEQWQTLDQLSTGQKATAILLLLLLESDAPLIVDQPEDDLDNRFITEGIVPRMREEKRRRQFLFATHNANIPVLGDAELILGLSAAGEGGSGRASVRPEHAGSIDMAPVRDLVEELLEGGREAFEERQRKYRY
jgi:energy-coupling factor transporter ATP-binding protein EcfA2